MLETLAAESLFDLKVVVRGGGSSAQQYGEIGAALGRAFVEALGEHSGVEAVGSATVATLDAVMSTYVDLGRGPYSSFKVSKRSDELDLLDVFSSELASESGLTLHLVEESGENRSRIFECAARAMGRALLMASRTDDRRRRSM
ncbi:MAG: hypothetical protein HY791_38615 [Deltaproteobacteria bacterium]|nr:hypothetical protein [Deltaproteobacteria bacterium]